MHLPGVGESVLFTHASLGLGVYSSVSLIAPSPPPTSSPQTKYPDVEITAAPASIRAGTGQSVIAVHESPLGSYLSTSLSSTPPPAPAIKYPNEPIPIADDAILAGVGQSVLLVHVSGSYSSMSCRDVPRLLPAKLYAFPLIAHPQFQSRIGVGASVFDVHVAVGVNSSVSLQ